MVVYGPVACIPMDCCLVEVDGRLGFVGQCAVYLVGSLVLLDSFVRMVAMGPTKSGTDYLVLGPTWVDQGEGELVSWSTQ